MPATTRGSSQQPRRRRIADLTDEQKLRKRQIDRQAQQAFRERTKAQIQNLEDEIEGTQRTATESAETLRLENARLQGQVHSLSQQLEQIRRIANVQENDSFITRSNDAIDIQSHENANVATAISPESMIIIAEREPIRATGSVSELGSTEPAEEVNEEHNINEQYERQHPPAISSGSITAPHNANYTTSTSWPAESSISAHCLDTHAVMNNDYDSTVAYGTIEPHTLLPNLSPGTAVSDQRPQPWLPGSDHRPRREIHDIVCEHIAPTCPFDHILHELLRSKSTMLIDGSPVEHVIGPPHADIMGLFQPEKAHESHPLSRALVEVMHTFAHVGLPERVAFMYKIHRTMRWHISPSLGTYDMLPTWLRPTAKQIISPHASWIDNIAWPGVRDMLIEHPDKYPFNEFSEVYSNNVTINWPFSAADVVVNLPTIGGGGNAAQAIINPMFERHIRKLDNWTVAGEFETYYPEMHNAIYSRD